MAAHINLATTYGVTVPAGSVANSAEKTSTIDVSEVTGVSGEIVKADPLKVVKVEVSVSGVGPAGRATVTVGVVAPATMSVISAEETESNKGRVQFSIKAAGHEDFDDAAGSVTADDEPTVDTLNIVSVAYACAESVKRSVEVTDSVLLGSDGKPCDRAKVKKMGSFDVQGRGDLPAGVALGTGGVNVAGFSGGKIICTTLKESEKAGDWNGWGGSGKHYPAAA
jgi:hypothetical protein